MWITGHSYIKQKGKEVGAALAGERSGHIFYYQDYYGFDDAIFGALKLAEFLSHDNRKFSEIIKQEIPHWVTSPVWHAPCADEVKYKIVEELVLQFKKEYGPERVVDVNGARVSFDDGWGLVRASSNVPALVLVFESKTEEGLRSIEKIFREKLLKYNEVGVEWESM
jgi:phosphomannomutase/phosphoglucomutase